MRESTRMIAFPGYLKGTREMQDIPRRVDVGVEDGLAESWRSFREALQAKILLWARHQDGPMMVCAYQHLVSRFFYILLSGISPLSSL
jgi:hypothetical protein